MALTRLCVFCGSSPGADPAYAQAARDLAAEMVARGVGLVYGGSSVGLMGEVADAVLAAGGEAVGVLPRLLDRREIAHTGLSELHLVDSMHARKARMAELSDAFVALPGGLGTLEEVLEIATWSQLHLHEKPVALLDVRGYWHGLEAQLDHAVRERFMAPANRRGLGSHTTPAALLDALAAWTPAPGEKWLGAGERAVAEVGPRGPLVGVSALVLREGRLLLARRRGAHGAGTWSPPGGKVEPGEAPAAAVVRELLEEAGLRATRVVPAGWTDDLFAEQALHYVTLHHLVEADGEPERREPDKAEAWTWQALDALPEPLFAPVTSLLATGWRPPR